MTTITGTRHNERTQQRGSKTWPIGETVLKALKTLNQKG